jgi:hypothetical protein
VRLAPRMGRVAPPLLALISGAPRTSTQTAIAPDDHADFTFGVPGPVPPDPITDPDLAHPTELFVRARLAQPGAMGV